MMRRIFRRLAAPFRAIASGLGKIWPELLQTFWILGGWALLTWGTASLTVWQAWPISGGVFCLSIAGWGFLGTLFSKGLYTLSRQKPKEVKRG